MNCQKCDKAQSLGFNTAGAFDARCAGCITRLVKSARPQKSQQEAHIKHVIRFHGKVWDDVKNRLKAEK